MLSNFFVALSAVVPLFCLIFIGVLVKRYQLLTDLELNHVNRMVFRNIRSPHIAPQRLYRTGIIRRRDSIG